MYNCALVKPNLICLLIASQPAPRQTRRQFSNEFSWIRILRFITVIIIFSAINRAYFQTRQFVKFNKGWNLRGRELKLKFIGLVFAAREREKERKREREWTEGRRGEEEGWERKRSDLTWKWCTLRIAVCRFLNLISLLTRQRRRRYAGVHSI